MRDFESNNELIRKVKSEPFLMVHNSLNKAGFPDVLSIDNPEEIPYYQFILGNEYNFYSSPERSNNVVLKKN